MYTINRLEFLKKTHSLPCGTHRVLIHDVTLILLELPGPEVGGSAVLRYG